MSAEANARGNCPLRKSVATARALASSHFGGDIAKRAVALVAEQRRRRAVVQNEQVNIAMIVEVCGHHRDRVTTRSCYFRGCSDVSEFAVAVVAKQKIRRAGKIVREHK